MTALFALAIGFALAVMCAFVSDLILSYAVFHGDNIGNWNLLSIGVWMIVTVPFMASVL